MTILEYKDWFYLGFFIIAMYFSNRNSYDMGIRRGIEGCIDGMIKDGLIDYDEETEEISAKRQ